MKCDKGSCGGPAKHNSIWINAPYVSLLRVSLSEIPNRSLGVMHSAEDRFLQRGLEIEHIVDAKSITDGGRNIAHACQIFTQRDDIRPCVASGKKKASVC